jgi:hypothetical protein
VDVIGTECEVVDRLHLELGMDQWWALVEMIVKLLVPKKRRDCSDQLFDCQRLKDWNLLLLRSPAECQFQFNQ